MVLLSGLPERFRRQGHESQGLMKEFLPSAKYPAAAQNLMSLLILLLSSVWTGERNLKGAFTGTLKHAIECVGKALCDPSLGTWSQLEVEATAAESLPFRCRRVHLDESQEEG